MLKRQLAAAFAATLMLSGCSDESKFVGKYRDPDGSTVEFLSDGSAVFTIGSQQAVWKWSLHDGSRLKLEPTANILGATAAMCDYALNGDSLRVTGCEYAMRLTRM